MQIKASASIRNNYNEISQLCKETGEPVFLTKNGEGDLVVMSIEAFEKKENMLKLNRELQKVREARLNGEKGCTIEETIANMQNAVDEVANAKI